MPTSGCAGLIGISTVKMNIFALDKSAARAARYHCDKHVVKMIIESAQLLSTAHHSLDPETTLSSIYKPLKGHSSELKAWCYATGSNYAWLWCLAMNLCDEFNMRYGKTHKTFEVLNGPLRICPASLLATLRAPVTPFAQCMPEPYKHADPVLAYRTYYVAEKMHFAKWKNRQPPPWIEDVRYRAETLKEQVIDSTRIYLD